MTVSLTLTDAQVAEVMHGASLAGAVDDLLAGLDDQQRLRAVMAQHSEDRRYSRSGIRFLMILGAFAKDGSERSLKEVATEIKLPSSTTFRYINTWLVLGALEQNPVSHRYRRVIVAPGEAPRP
jgi:hypothetical protein